MQPWLRFFRVVNLPTVPGDVLVGAAAVIWGSIDYNTMAVCVSAKAIVAACFASIFLYMFGLADNDIVGAKKDGSERPIPAGEISLRSARNARVLCCISSMLAGIFGGLRGVWWVAAFLLAVAVVVYNRTKRPLMMGLCRGLNVFCGGAALLVGGCLGEQAEAGCVLLGVSAIWTLYIAVVTKYSEGEEKDPAKRRCVGCWIGALVYLQLGALLFFYLKSPILVLRNLLLVGAGLLLVLRLMKRVFPRVSAS